MKNSKEKERILIVDDSPETIEMLERNLRSEGYEVFSADNVMDAIAILDDIVADLVITDFKMPKSTGMDLIRYVRENLKNTEIMMITGYATVEGAVDAIKAGAEEYLAKPFTRGELLARIKTLLNLKSSTDQRSRNLEELSRLRYFLKSILDSMPSMLIALDTDGKVTQWNREAE